MIWSECQNRKCDALKCSKQWLFLEYPRSVEAKTIPQFSYLEYDHVLKNKTSYNIKQFNKNNKQYWTTLLVKQND